MNFLKGYITYIAAAGMLCLAVASYVQGDTETAMKQATEALGFFGLRRAVG